MTKATKRVIIVAVAFVVMAAIVLGMVAALTNGGTGENKVTENGGMIMGESDGNGVALTSSVIAPEDYAAYGVSALAESAYTVTATITPSNAVDKTVDWSVSWANAESEFATGKTVTDYVTVTPESDGALTATVECLQAFGEQIVLTVSSRQKPSISAICTIDYSSKITDCMITFGLEFSGRVPESLVLNASNNSYVFDDTSLSAFNYGDFELLKGNYTVDVSFDVNVYYTGNEDFLDLLIEADVPHDGSSIEIYKNDLTRLGEIESDKVFYSGGSMISGKKGLYSISSTLDSAYMDEAYKIALSHLDVPFGFIEIEAFNDSYTFNSKYELYFSEEYLNYLLYSPENISLDNSSIVF